MIKRSLLVRSCLVLGATAILAACQPAVPNSGAAVGNPGRGVGFDNPMSLTAIEARNAQLAGDSIAPPPATAQNTAVQRVNNTQTAVQQQSQTVVPPRQQTARAVSDPAGLDAELAQIAAQNDADAAAANSGRQVINASPSNAAPVILNNPGISDENDFDAVSSRQSIESDAARLQAQRQQYTVVQPTALPTRSGSQQPNVVQYALQTSHPRGTRVHRRFGVNQQSRFQRACAQYASADEAQIDFLSSGGPSRDRKGLDPDGDGYACNWDPAPFRRAAGN